MNYFSRDLAKVLMTIAAFTKHKLIFKHSETTDATYYELPNYYAEKYFKRETTKNLKNTIDGALEKLWKDKDSLDKTEETVTGVLKFPVSQKVTTYNGALMAPTRALLLAQMLSDDVGTYILGKDTNLTHHLLSKITYTNFDLFPSKNYSFINNPSKVLYDMISRNYPQMIVDSIPSKIYDEEMEKRNKPLTLNFAAASENTEFDDLLDKLYAEQRENFWSKKVDTDEVIESSPW